jgi:surfactin synthase thioesterase subunit
VVEVPVDGGGRLLVQAFDDDLPGGLELAALQPGRIVARAQESLEAALDQIKPAIHAVVGRLTAMSPDEATVEFGILLGAETGAIVAKGTAEVHFAITLTWRRATAEQPPGGSGDDGGPKDDEAKPEGDGPDA